MARLTISSAAEKDYTEALLWYAEQSVAAAEQFEVEFARTLKEVVTTPDRYPKCDRRHRYCLLHRFPFRVIYRVQSNEVIVIALAHAKRSPDFWSRR